jgi:hypothetical protein
MSWIDLEKETPNHKDLVLCWDGKLTQPAIYFDNQSFCGFYYYTTYYHEVTPKIYSKVKLKPKHKIDGVLKWKLIDEPTAEVSTDLLKNTNPWLSPINSEREWQESHIKNIWEGYPNICPNWQIMNGLIRYSCEHLNIDVIEP